MNSLSNQYVNTWATSPVRVRTMTPSTIDLHYLRSTDLAFNSFVHMPPALEEDEEIKLQNLKMDFMKVTDGYIRETKEEEKKNGQQKKYINFTESEGLRAYKRGNKLWSFRRINRGG